MTDNVVQLADRRRRKQRLARAQEWARMKHPSGDMKRCPYCFLWVPMGDTHTCAT